ncbi:MAG: discoidin domain-containing protein [Desulfuromonadales bacterium]|nr:discoidin domain-containing protein [Desulfuromonadales bacterium]
MSIQERIAKSVCGRMVLLSSVVFGLVLMPCLLFADWGDSTTYSSAAASSTSTSSTTTTMIPTDCALCHGDNVAEGHHQSELYTQGLCNQCHEGVTTNGDCASCHTFVPQQNGHHDTAAATSGNCAECHANVGDLADCLDCHQGKIKTPHHTVANDSTNPIDCASCHTAMTPMAGCVGCHSGNIQNTHHTAATTDGIDCASCHTEITPVANCESCHNPADYWQGQSARDIHHASVAAQADCTTCHTNAPRPFNCHDCHQGEASDRHHVMLQNPPGLTCANCHDAIVVDTKRTNPTQDKAYAGCQVCHAPSDDNQVQHHAVATNDPAISCNDCHADAGNVPDCTVCHDAASWGVDSSNAALSARDVHHGFVVEAGKQCTDCHATLIIDSSCNACHFSGEERLREHHNPENSDIPAGLSCGFCHGASADIPTVGSCQFCHDTGFWQASGRAGSSMAEHHEVLLGSPGGQDCAACHETLVPQTCLTCHDNTFWGSAGRAGSAAAQHHEVITTTDGLVCSSCHTGGLPGENNDCQACHSGEAQVFHHENVAPGRNCQECHTDLPVVANCQSCHTADNWAVDARTDHHSSATFAGNDCSACHSGLTLGQDCESCHTSGQWVTDARTDHHNVASTNGASCNTCHMSVAPTNGCGSCHGDDWNTPDPVSGQLKENLHHTSTGYGFGCLNCHSYSPTWSLLMPAEATCKTCHTTILATTTVPQLHHATSASAANNCGQCHQGITDIDPSSLECANCHASQTAAKNGSPAMHHLTASAVSDQCADCHAAVTQASLDCATCHARQTVRADLKGTPPMHHAPAYDDNSCADCHQNVVALDCAGCHIDPSDPDLVPIPERHHNTIKVDPTVCSNCHTGADLAVNNCELCHVGNGQPAVSTRHHAAGSYTPGNCVSCHEGIDGVTGDALDCATCHVDKARNGDQAMHHKTADGAPDYAADNCSTCHNVLNFAQMIIGNACVECHADGNPAIIAGRHHATAPAAADNCAACHTVDQAQLDCATCHAGQTPKDGKAVMHHATEKATTGSCLDCHATVDVSNVTCASCHAAQPVLNGGLAMHHATAAYGNGLCMTCHVGAESALMDCASCHVDPNNPTPISERHHNSSYAQAAACTDCHKTVNTAGLDCKLCHAQQPAALSGSPAMHHDMTIAGTTKQCTTCHAGATIAENDCSVCHLASEKPPSAEMHHATETFQTGLCSACHVGTEAQSIVCVDCHGNDSSHHTQAAYADGTCNACHTDITLNGANCEECHAGAGQPSIPETHHTAALTSVGGDCSVCHQSVSTPDVCGNCHDASPHHTTAWADFGVCEQCHTWAPDKDENPQQAACRQCHGSSMHGKNSAAPIHDYRACFSCHGSGGNMETTFPTAVNVLPFHASPGKAVGFSSSGNTQAVGRGTFNMFYSTWGGESRNEERFGEHEDWENKARDSQRTTLSYTKVQISEQGKTYQVPKFSDISMPNLPGTGGDINPGGNGLTVCISCHSDYKALVNCNNMKWRDHKTLNRVDLATYQLAESTYLGSYCPDLPAVPVNLALNKSASSSGDEGSSYQASRAVDGNGGTRWYKRSSSSQWIKVDLGTTTSVSKVLIKWHSEYAREYDVLISTDNRNWSRVKSEGSGNGGVDTVTFTARNTRYVRIDCDRERDRGYSIYELEVYK